MRATDRRQTDWQQHIQRFHIASRGKKIHDCKTKFSNVGGVTNRGRWDTFLPRSFDSAILRIELESYTLVQYINTVHTIKEE